MTLPSIKTRCPQPLDIGASYSPSPTASHDCHSAPPRSAPTVDGASVASASCGAGRVIRLGLLVVVIDRGWGFGLPGRTRVGWRGRVESNGTSAAGRTQSPRRSRSRRLGGPAAGRRRHPSQLGIPLGLRFVFDTEPIDSAHLPASKRNHRRLLVDSLDPASSPPHRSWATSPRRGVRSETSTAQSIETVNSNAVYERTHTP
jgi:hypothetical protein